MNDGYLSSALGVALPLWGDLLAVALLGLLAGSFISALSYRLPKEEDWVRKPSACPSCQHLLGWRDLVPLFSFVIQRGLCRYCGGAIGWRYPLIEISTAAIFAISCYFISDAAQFWVLAGFVVLMIAAVVIDLEHRILPDRLQLALAGLGVVYHVAIVGRIHAAAWGAIEGWLIGWLLQWGYRAWRKKDGLGWGDVKFFAVAGLWLGASALPFFFFLSGLFGIGFGVLWKKWRGEARFPFAPAMAVALWVALLVQASSPGVLWGIFRL